MILDSFPKEIGDAAGLGSLVFLLAFLTLVLVIAYKSYQRDRRYRRKFYRVFKKSNLSR
ncbi:MAG: hypothetical protein H6626_05580 [Pseudobdellovibrionaceae bacterium]|nr:hypothetical protein [Bdellovibrionales bacterium]USN48565.1 MAG: hypothetical protein H6626_05580 [Pseudobdellovibrionaceae bacterium]